MISTRWKSIAAMLLMVAGGEQSSARAAEGDILPVAFFKKKPACVQCDAALVPVCPPQSIASPAEQPAVQPLPGAEAPIAPDNSEVAAPPNDAMLESLASSTNASAASGPVAPNMLGDFAGVFYTGAPEEVPTPDNPVDELQRAEFRSVTRFKIADNTSPRPRTRLFYDYNFFQDAFQTTGNIHRNFLGGEYAFWDDLASIEVRNSLNLFRNFPDSSGENAWGDLQTTLKGVLASQEDWLVSAGLGIGAPTGQLPQGIPAGNWYFSPFVGYLIAPTDANWFIQGFEQIDVPYKSQDQGLIHTDIAIGMWLLRDPQGTGWLTGLAPTAELHLYTPYGSPPAGPYANIIYNDVLNLTLGGTAMIGQNMTLAAAVGVPISTSKDYDLEVQVHLNWFFQRMR